MPSAKVVTCNYTYSTGASGIDHSAEGSRTVIRNGTVRGFGGGGVWVGDGSTMEDLFVEHNGYIGLVMTGAGRIRNVHAVYNQMHGILAYDAVIEGSISRFNGGSGYYLMNTLLIGSKADGNKSFGVMITGSSGASGVRESMLNGNMNGALYASPYLKSMGNNLCDGTAC
ncbi:hypothetical protein BH11PSE9_BH11PSE9_29690 [soil metagenome]